MCGITGYIDRKGRVQEGTINTMLQRIAHRGPDDVGSLNLSSGQASIVLGHQRLSIIDLSTLGHQPMSFNGLHIVYNGEIYNYAAVRQKLEQKGYSFTSGSDTEVLLKAFDCWHLDCIQQFIGMFAFCLYSVKEQAVYLVRDRVGVKPLYYHQSTDGLVFGSELKAITACKGLFEQSISSEGMYAYFKFGYIPAPYTIFDNTFKVKPGHYLKYEINGNRLMEHSYWNVLDYYNQPKFPDYLEAMEEVERLLVSAANYRMVSDVKNGVFLSGGYDSTALLALLRRNNTEKIKTFTIGFEDKAFNEAAHAKAVAEMFGTEHHEYYCTESDVIELIPKLAEVYDEPMADISCVPTLLLSKVTAQEVKVALSADGGDEVFGGYDKYYANLKMYQLATKVPRTAGRLAAKLLQGISGTSLTGGMRNAAVRLENMQEILRGGGSRESYVSKIQAKLYSDRELSVLLQTRGQLPKLKTAFDGISQLHPDVSILNSLFALDFQTFLPDDILVKVDRATMQYGLEGREPLLDHRIIEYVAGLPDQYKFDGTTRKKMLKDIVHKYVPQEMMDRPKQGFIMPIGKWMKKELKDQVCDVLHPSNIKNIPQLNDAFIRQTMQSFFSGKDPAATAKVWRAFTFVNWYNHSQR